MGDVMVAWGGWKLSRFYCSALVCSFQPIERKAIQYPVSERRDCCKVIGQNYSRPRAAPHGQTHIGI